MARRGPDAEGEWSDRESNLSLGHRRLAIIDLDARSNQPMRTHDGRFVIVFNGEIYNYRELRAELKSNGVRFDTNGDTEVILELYRRRGNSAFLMLRGMFALAIWDVEQRSLVLVRDPYGIKPLYVAKTSEGILFASQVKALQTTGIVSTEIDPAGLVGFYVWGSVPEPFTIYRDIQAVPAGSIVRVDRNGVTQTSCYADVRSAWLLTPPAEPNWADQVRNAVKESIRVHLIADVPVGIFLSGGVDSGVIAGVTAELGKSVEGITVSFDEFSGRNEDEVPRARAIADHYGIRHTVRKVDKREFLSDAPAILSSMDQPSIDGVNTWFAAKAVTERGLKVALSGIGGDELFAGYDTFHTVPGLYRFGRIVSAAGPMFGLTNNIFSLAATLLGKPKLAGVPTFSKTIDQAYLLRRCLMMPTELGSVICQEFIEEGLQRLAEGRRGGALGVEKFDQMAEVAALESTFYLRNQLLRDSDWASMAHSLELRTPFVDWKLLQQIAPQVSRFSSGRGKRLLAATPKRSLPGRIVDKKKTGFGLPLQGWLTDWQRYPETPPSMRQPWARQWSYIVAKSFGLLGVGHT